MGAPRWVPPLATTRSEKRDSEESEEMASSLGSGRTERDSWDLASSVGATATFVAARRALASQGPQALIDDRFAGPLVRAVGDDFFTRLLDGEIEWDDTSFTEQQMREQIAVRTRLFDDFLLDATAAGCRQAVLLAAGLDARAYRLSWPAGTVVFEIDQPEVIEFKTTTLARLGVAPTSVRRAVGIDLRDDWTTALCENFFDMDKPTAWIAEGLLMYLPPESQNRLLDNITGLSAPGSRMATEQLPDMSAFADTRSRAWLQRWRQYGLAIDGVELVWDGKRSQVGEYLSANDWQVTTHTARELYVANGFEFPGEQAVASFGSFDYLTAEMTAR
jgi:methyltransferase (TIGR00027 family)